MSQQQLGEALAAYGHGMRHELVYRVEVGGNRRPLRLNEAAAFAAALGVDLLALLPSADDQSARQVALTATIETSRQLAEAIEAAEEAQRRYDEAQQRLEEAQQQAAEAQRELLAANRRRSSALVAAEVAGMRYNTLPGQGA
jgi:chromosome segregation ATPase